MDCGRGKGRAERGARPAKQAGAMKTLFRLLFRKRVRPDTKLLRFYLNEYNAPNQARMPDGVRF